MTHRLHIVHVLEKNRLSTGSVVQMIEAAAGLSVRGHRITVVSRAGGDLEDRCAELGTHFHAIPLRHPVDLVSAWHLRRLLQRRPAEVIHVHKGRAHAIALLAAAGLGRLPRVVVNRGVSFPLTPCNRLKYRHPRVAAVVCVAEAVRREVLASGKVAPERVHTIYSATDTSRFDPSRVDGRSVRHELALDADELVVGTVSVREWKGWRHLIAAAGELAGRLSELRVLVVGCADDDARRAVHAEAARHGIEGRVRALGFRDDMPELLAACDVVVDASTAGTGITGTIREAMAMSRAVVVTDCAGNRELVEHEHNGFVVPMADPPALAAAIDRLLTEPELGRRLGAAARSRVVEHFSVTRRIDTLEALYRRILV